MSITNNFTGHLTRTQNKKIISEFIQRLEMKTFDSDEDRANFFSGLSRGLEPPSKREPLTFKDQAVNMVLDAENLPDETGRKLATKALSIDPNSIEAYLYLGSVEPQLKAISYFKKGIKIGKELFNDEYLKENTGLFWNIPETRPFMECLNGYAVILYDLDRFAEAIPILEHILKLNITDDMGARRLLMLSLIKTDDIKKFRKYDEKFQDNDAQQLFNRALFTLKISGDNDTSRNLLYQANKENKNIIPGLISMSKIKRFPFFEKEDLNFVIAFEYIIMAKKIWIQTDGAINWIRKNIDFLRNLG